MPMETNNIKITILDFIINLTIDLLDFDTLSVKYYK